MFALEPPRLILASASPRRRELLTLLGLPFEVITSRYQEPSAPSEPVDLADFVVELATNKALEVASRIDQGIIIGADTLVTACSHGDVGIALGKPVDDDDACRMLRLLSGKVHRVFTGVAVLTVGYPTHVESEARIQLKCTAIQTKVKFRPLTDQMIADYVATGEPHDKAGAYGAQGYAAPFIESFEGDFFNVVGLPLCALGQFLEDSGLNWWHYRQQMAVPS